jgi:hypothetical protein
LPASSRPCWGTSRKSSQRARSASGIAGFLARGLLFETAPLDPASLGIAASLLILTAVIAHLAPLRRALRAGPRHALVGD